MITTKTLKLWFLVHFLLTAAASLLLLGQGSQVASINFLIGALFSGLNVLLITWTWSRFLSKKSVASTLMGIVSKYAILIILITWMSERGIFHPLGFVFGIASFAVSSIVVALATAAKKRT